MTVAWICQVIFWATRVANFCHVGLRGFSISPRWNFMEVRVVHKSAFVLMVLVLLSVTSPAQKKKSAAPEPDKSKMTQRGANPQDEAKANAAIGTNGAEP